jgi:hypothetical protein
MSTAVAEVRGSRAVAAGRPKLVADTLKDESEQRQLLGEYVKREMVPGTDFGLIPGTDRRSLLKPGAEKLCSLFRCTPRFEIVEKTEDWDKPFFYYLFRVTVETNDGGAVVAEGFGSANSMEGKWRWRNADRKCPECGKPAIKRSKFPPRDNPQAEPGWYCFGKAGGCGANFAAADPAIVGQTAGRVENDDVPTLVNTILKIAKKRALVDAAIALARCSDLFTQDVEDAEGADHDATAKAAGRKAAPPQQTDQPADDPHDDPQPENGGPAAAMLRTELEHKVKELARLRGRTADEVHKGLRDAAKSKNPNHPDRLEDVHPNGLRWLIKKADGWLDELKAKAAEPKPEAQPTDVGEPARSFWLTIPTTGPEFARWLRNADAELNAAKVSIAGNLVAEVQQSVMRAGYGADMTKWDGVAIQLATHTARDYARRLNLTIPLDRQPGEDDPEPDDADGEQDETHDTGNPVGQQPPADAARRVLADQTIAILHQCGTDWNTAIVESLGIIGRRLLRGAHAAECSQEEHICIRAWAKKRKAERDKARQGQGATA